MTTTNTTQSATTDATDATDTTDATVIITTDDGKTKTYRIYNTTDDKESDDVRTILAGNIIRNRRRLKMSRAQLAKKIGITETAVGQYERAIRSPQLGLLCKLADALSVTVDALIGRNYETCDLVMKFRFDRAKHLIQWCGFLVDETYNGEIIVGIENKALSFSKDEKGIIYADPITKKSYDVLCVFRDRQSFVLYVDDIIVGHIYITQDSELSLKNCFESVFKTKGSDRTSKAQGKIYEAVTPKIRKRLKRK